MEKKVIGVFRGLTKNSSYPAMFRDFLREDCEINVEIGFINEDKTECEVLVPRIASEYEIGVAQGYAKGMSSRSTALFYFK